jgi:TPP-dependent indolepyruvate ferredoxin oxidoreductase alpha subunit
MNMVYNKATGTVIILDNSTTGMTGHQDHPATGKTLSGEKANIVLLDDLCRALGVKNVQIVMDGITIGIVTLFNNCQSDAPSILLKKK